MNEIDDPDMQRQVTEAFERYGAALTGTDVPTLDALFRASDHVLRLGATENLHGHAQVRALRRARPSRGPQRRLRTTVITTFGTEFATACTEFTRRGTDRIGRQTRSWARLADGWKIVAAHVAGMDAP